MAGVFLWRRRLKLRLRLTKLHTMKRMVIVVLLLLALPAWAVALEVFRNPDSGNGVEFADHPGTASQRIEILPPATVAPLNGSNPSPPSAVSGAVVAASYTRLNISEPAAGATIYNQAEIAVAAELTPALQTALGHRLQFFLDGEAVAEPGTSARITLPEVERGAHVLLARILNAEGRPLRTSSPSSFYVHRRSILKPPIPPH